jgi:hypothetical protein
MGEMYMLVNKTEQNEDIAVNLILYNVGQNYKIRKIYRHSNERDGYEISPFYRFTGDNNTRCRTYRIKQKIAGEKTMTTGNKDCKEEMKDPNTTSCRFNEVRIGRKWYKRNTTHYDIGERCHDCNIVNKPGNVHHWGCDMERCPKCGEQFISCACDQIEVRER